MAGGADIIDVKEPFHGPLGKADTNVVREIQETVGTQVPLSMACGELADYAQNRSAPLPKIGLTFAKIGLARCDLDQQFPSQKRTTTTPWAICWQQWIKNLPAQTKPIAVIYADRENAKSPAPVEILQISQQLGCQGVLVDTFAKRDSKTLFDYCPADELREWIRIAHIGEQFIAVAGSLTSELFPLAVNLGADVVAVRGAACSKSRVDPICKQKVRRLSNVLSTCASNEIATQ